MSLPHAVSFVPRPWRGLLLALLMGAIGVPAFAQDDVGADSTKLRPYQIGFAASAFLTVLEEEDEPDQYQVYGRYRFNRRWALRAAVRYRHRVSDEQEVRLGVRLGADYVFLEEGPLDLYAGADLLTGFDQFLSGDRTYRVGLAPTFGALLSITPHVSISTEPRLVARYTYDQNRSSPEPNTDSVSVGVRGTGVLILSVHF